MRNEERAGTKEERGNRERKGEVAARQIKSPLVHSALTGAGRSIWRCRNLWLGYQFTSELRLVPKPRQHLNLDIFMYLITDYELLSPPLKGHLPQSPYLPFHLANLYYLY